MFLQDCTFCCRRVFRCVKALSFSNYAPTDKSRVYVENIGISYNYNFLLKLVRVDLAGLSFMRCTLRGVSANSWPSCGTSFNSSTWCIWIEIFLRSNRAFSDSLLTIFIVETFLSSDFLTGGAGHTSFWKLFSYSLYAVDSCLPIVSWRMNSPPPFLFIDVFAVESFFSFVIVEPGMLFTIISMGCLLFLLYSKVVGTNVLPAWSSSVGTIWFWTACNAGLSSSSLISSPFCLSSSSFLCCYSSIPKSYSCFSWS